MTESLHAYTATLLGSPNRALSLRGGGITLDDTSAPHVTGSITIALPALATLALLDTRSTPPPRVQVVATATLASTTQTRTFNLTLRDRTIDHRAATVTLALSSDEALASDYRPLADDDAAYASQGSLRSIVNYALGKAIPGATLATGTAGVPSNAPTAFWVNYVPNRRGSVTTDGWSSTGTNAPQRIPSGASDGGTYVTFAQMNAGAVRINQTIPNQPVTAGGALRVSVELRTLAAVPITLRVRTNGSSWSESAVMTTRQGEWSTHTADIPIPTGATTLDQVEIVCANNGLVPFGWDVANLRVIETTNTRDPDILVMRAGTDALSFIAGIVQSVGLRPVCDETRVWSLRNEDYAAPGALTIRHGVNLLDADDRLSRTDEQWCDAVIVIYTWTDRWGNPARYVESATLSATPSRPITVERRDTPYPGPGLAAYILRRAQGRGRNVSAKTVSDWTARAEQSVQIVLDGAPTQTGKTSRVEFDLDRDEMTITTRTVDTPAGAIDLLPSTIDALTGTIDNL